VALAADRPLAWHKSSACTATESCVEIAALPDGGAAMRDSKDPSSPELRFDAAGWAAFVTQAKQGGFAAAVE
jgi:Domain of unknown function (DUF397)